MTSSTMAAGATITAQQAAHLTHTLITDVSTAYNNQISVPTDERGHRPLLLVFLSPLASHTPPLQ